eukprot:TRINITY_DN11742_c0_g1_i2.p1 TRINITY_DN11742_c0_g1~~TRINITY_DN11742_c0_g1_i2.p1  ORF type:complete len:987 (+),score=252.39 TRINITY_DN11742_c0_g1_i2:83-2962(+)
MSAVVPPASASEVFFRGDKPRQIGLHAVYPWVALAMKQSSEVIIFDYDRAVELARYNLQEALEAQRDRNDLYCILNEESAQGAAAPKLGEIRTVHFLDNSCIYWNSAPLWHRGILHILGEMPSAFAKSDGTSGTAQQGHTRQTLFAVHGCSIVVVAGERAVVMPLGPHPHDRSGGIAEVSAQQLDSKPFTCGTPLWCAPVLAIGTADGTVRLWNYEQRQTGYRLPAVQKAVAALCVWHEDEAQVFGHSCVLAVGSADGVVAVAVLMNLAAPAPKQCHKQLWNRKVGESVIAIHYQRKELVILCGGGLLVVTGATSGKELRQAKLPKRPVGICPVRGQRGCGAALAVVHERSTIGSVAADSSLSQGARGDVSDLTGVLQQKDPHLYCAASTPLARDVIIAGTNGGLVRLDFRDHTLLPCCTLAHREDAMAPEVLVVHRGRVMRCAITGSDDAAHTSGFPADVHSLRASPSGRAVACLTLGHPRAEVTVVKPAGAEAGPSSRVDGRACGWHFARDLIGVLVDSPEGPRITVHAADGAELTAQGRGFVISGGAAAEGLWGGRWLAVAHANDTVVFWTWTGERVGEPLPRPREVRWDQGGALCALVYSDAVAIMQTAAGSFSHLCTFPQRVASCVWFRGTLFADTQCELLAIFAAPGTYDARVVASADVGPFYQAVLSAAHQGVASCAAHRGHDCQHIRPPGRLDLLGVVGGALVTCDAATGRVESLALPGEVRWRLAAQAGHVAAADAWIRSGAAAAPAVARFLAERGRMGEGLAFELLSAEDAAALAPLGAAPGQPAAAQSAPSWAGAAASGPPSAAAPQPASPAGSGAQRRGGRALGADGRQRAASAPRLRSPPAARSGSGGFPSARSRPGDWEQVLRLAFARADSGRSGTAPRRELVSQLRSTDCLGGADADWAARLLARIGNDRSDSITWHEFEAQFRTCLAAAPRGPGDGQPLPRRP